MSRFARKIDRVQPVIQSALEAAGVCVVDLSWCGRGVPDLVAVFKGRIYFLEVKTPPPTKKPRTTPWVPPPSEFTPAEMEMRRKLPIHVVTTPGEALRAVGVEVAGAR